MTAQLNPEQHGTFKVPPTKAPSGISRMSGLLKKGISITVLAGVALLAAAYMAADDKKSFWASVASLPGALEGRIHGEAIEKSADAQVELAQRLADIEVAKNIRIAATNAEIQRRSDSLDGEVQITNTVDGLCAISIMTGMIGGLFGNHDLTNGAAKFAQATCGVSNQLRNSTVQSQQELLKPLRIDPNR